MSYVFKEFNNYESRKARDYCQFTGSGEVEKKFRASLADFGR